MRRTELARTRKAAGLNQETLADQIGVTKTTVSQWEGGHETPNPHNRVLLAQALGISLRELDRLLFGSKPRIKVIFLCPKEYA